MSNRKMGDKCEKFFALISDTFGASADQYATQDPGATEREREGAH